MQELPGKLAGVRTGAVVGVVLEGKSSGRSRSKARIGKEPPFSSLGIDLEKVNVQELEHVDCSHGDRLGLATRFEMS